MKIMVTGGAGFIGSAVCRHLVGDLGHEVVNVDKALQVLPGRVLLSSQNVNDSGHRITGSRLDFPIMPGQAVLVNCGNVQGTVMVYATAIAALDNIAD